MSKSRRVNFLKSTRKILAGNAGHMCSFYDCGKPTIGPEIKGDGTVGVKGIAVAAHIYAASPGGPRPPVGLTDKEIRAESNGIWLCPDDALKVDTFQFEYPAELLLEMKQVRVFAQSLALQNPTVSFMAHSIGMKRLDSIVRKHLPDLDKEKIIEAVKAAYIRTEIAHSTAELPFPTASIALSSVHTLSRVIREVMVCANHRLKIEDQVWRDVIADWSTHFGKFKRPPQESVTLVDRGYAKISARNPKTGEILKDGVQTGAFVMLSDGADPSNPMTKHLLLQNTFTSFSSLEWKLNVKPAFGTFEVESELNVYKDVSPRNSVFNSDRESFESYAAVLEKLTLGWEPIGYVGLSVGEGNDDGNYHPTPVSIACQIKPEQFESRIRRCERVKLGYEIADEFDATMKFTPVFFNQSINDAALSEAAADFLTELGPKPWNLLCSSKPIMRVNDDVEMYFQLKHLELSAETRFVRRLT
ncbi:hypothetical protein [Pseudomonas sp. DP16D-R1]|jgi:hypothetical protein|uniref:hypothetical protein n=1 Tax=Pseudomonas sp. DP16D-R1 TaxID=2075551 RepID=UPI000CD38F22|nr:hypothetical protein [Pseudomonas sp. DP16D-R1]POA78680.1 hypothetical protein C1890_10125 [Pseudomonas sp. DP16D-R1]